MKSLKVFCVKAQTFLKFTNFNPVCTCWFRIYECRTGLLNILDLISSVQLLFKELILAHLRLDYFLGRCL